MNRGLLLLIAVAPTIALLFWASESGSLYRRIDRAAQNRELDEEAGATLAALANPFVTGTPYAGKINSTVPAIQGDLNVYVTSNPEALQPGLTCNCAYLGEGVIACDKRFLSTFSSSLAFNNRDPKFAVLALVDQSSRKLLESWLVGHEIGHAVLHDKSGAWSETLQRRSLTETQEIQADEYVIRRSAPQDSSRLEFTLTNFVFQGISLSYRSKGSGPLAGKAVIQPSKDGVHPPWLLRALRMADLLARQKSLNGQDASYYPELKDSIRVDPTGTDVGSMCTNENLRAAATSAMARRAKESTISAQ